MSKLQWNGEAVATTAMLAEHLGTESVRLIQNFNKNKDKYEEGEHYFLLKGNDLKTFKKDYIALNDVVKIDPRAPSLYLWTEFGALNHVKSLDTDEAWAAYNRLVKGYFKAREAIEAQQNAGAATPLLPFTERPVQVQNSKEVNSYNFSKGGKEQAIEYNRKNCLLHTGFTPTEIVDHAKKKGLPSRRRTSAKEVLRHVKPATAASMALADDFCKTGRMTIEESATFCKETALPLFQKMQEFGLLNRGQQ